MSTEPVAASEAPPVGPAVDDAALGGLDACDGGGDVEVVVGAVANGCAFDLADAPVLAVPADEGFWISAPDGQPAWVHLVGHGESAVVVRAGHAVTLHGTIRAVESADAAGVPDSQVAALAARSAYLEVGFEDVIVVG